MCTDGVAQIVRQRIEREGLPNFSRRGFMRVLGLGAVATAAATMTSRVARAQDMMGEVIDLSHVLSEDFPVFPAFQPATRRSLVTVEENGFYAQEWTFGEHTSTHLDAPGHFIGGGALVPDIAPSMLVGSAVIIDISEKASENADAMVTVEDITAWEETNETIPAGSFVMMHSGWEAFVGEDTFSGTDADGVLHFPGFSPEASLFLVEERNIKGIGVDTLSLDVGTSATFDVHYNILGAGLLGIENLRNLAAIKDTIATVVLGVPKYAEGSGGPLRVLAMT